MQHGLSPGRPGVLHLVGKWGDGGTAILTSRDILARIVAAGRADLGDSVLALWHKDWPHVGPLVTVGAGREGGPPPAATVVLVGPWETEAEAAGAQAQVQTPQGARTKVTQLAVWQGPPAGTREEHPEGTEVCQTWAVVLELGAVDSVPPSPSCPAVSGPMSSGRG